MRTLTFSSYLGVMLLLMICTSCDTEQSLQEYFIDSKENTDFVSLNVPASFLSPDKARLSDRQKEVLKTIEKVNILALPLSSDTEQLYQSERSKVKAILTQDGYEELMAMGKPSQRMRFYLKGDTDAIDEVVVFALDDSKGLLLARILGKDMNVASMVRLAETANQQDSTLNTAQFEGILDIFKEEK